MPKESREDRRARKAAAKAAARDRAARITAGEVPDYLLRPFNPPPVKPRPLKPRLVKARYKTVQAPPEQPARALIPPTDRPLRPRAREQYADNAPPVWVKDGPDAQDEY